MEWENFLQGWARGREIHGYEHNLLYCVASNLHSTNSMNVSLANQNCCPHDNSRRPSLL